MDTDDATLLRELKRALDAVDGGGLEAQATALREVLQRHGATFADVHRAMERARRRQRDELAGLASRISQLADQREDDLDTAEAVDVFLRAFRQRG